ncbi:MAG: glycosyltransferase family A protein [Thermoplasmata archaeon]
MISFITPMRRFDPTNLQRIRTMLPPGCEFIAVSVPGGAAHARNVGAVAASGAVFVFVDDDVQLKSDWDWENWLRRDWQFAIAALYWPGPTANTFMMRTECTMLNVLTSVFRYKLSMSGFAAIRREAFEAVHGYNEFVVYEEHAITLDFYRHHFKGARLPIHVQMLRRWHSWSPHNDVTSRGKEHPPPQPGEVLVQRT